MLFASGILYLVIGWYLEQVLPSRLGVQKPLLFFLSPKYWQCNKRRVPGSDRLQDSLIDHDDAAGKVTLQGKAVLRAVVAVDDDDDDDDDDNDNDMIMMMMMINL